MHNGEWYYLPPKKDTFVINFGNMLEHISYGVIKGQYNLLFKIINDFEVVIFEQFWKKKNKCTIL